MNTNSGTRGFTIATIRKKANRIGATVECNDNGRTVNVDVDAPDGKVWNANECHHLHTTWDKHSEAHRNEAIVDVLERIEMGTSDCDDSDCDVCGSQSS